MQAGGNREGLNFSNIKMMRLPNFNYLEQKKLRFQYELIKENQIAHINEIKKIKALQASLIDQVF